MSSVELGRYTRKSDGREVLVIEIDEDGEHLTIRYKQKLGYRYTTTKVTVEKFLPRHVRSRPR